MNKLYALIAATFIAIPSSQVMAAAVDNNDVVPPAQIQKNQVPDSTANGNYLEPQPDENGATGNTTDKQTDKQKSHKAKSKGAKATNIEKSKKVTETPDNGGVDVKQN